MKIGFFTDSYLPSPDGVATSVDACARELQKLGHIVYIIAPNQPHHKDRKNIYRLISFRIMKSPDIWIPLEIPQLSLIKIASLELDIIHGHSGGLVSFLGWQLAILHNIPFVETYHTLWRHYRHYFPYPKLLKIKMIKKITAFIGNDCDAVIAPTEKAKQDLISDGVKKPIYIVPSGIYTGKFKHQSNNFFYRTYGISASKTIILTVGRLEKEKSIDFLINSFAQVHKNIPGSIFIIIGEGHEKSKLHKLCARHNLTDSIYFIGNVPYADIAYAYSGAKLFIFSSQSETQGMVLVEALAAGLPIVAVEDDAYKNVIVNEINGYLVKKDPDIFAQKIIKILRDKTLYSGLSKKAKITAEQFSVHKTAKELEKVYLRIIADKTYRKNNYMRKLLLIFSGSSLKKVIRK